MRRAFRIDSKLRVPDASRTLLTTKVRSVARLVPYYLNERLSGQQGVLLVPLDLDVSFMENLRAVAWPAELRKYVLKLKIPVVRGVVSDVGFSAPAQRSSPQPLPRHRRPCAERATESTVVPPGFLSRVSEGDRG